MRNQRGNKVDWSRPFKLMSSRKEFELLQGAQQEAKTDAPKDQSQKQAHQDKKQQIVVPKIEVVRRITQVKPFAGVPLEYVRLRKDLNLPHAQYYELTEVDHIFVNAHQNKFKFNGKNVLNTSFLQKAFVFLQKKAAKDPLIPRNKNWVLNFIEKEYKQLAKMEKYQQFTDAIYNYWRNRRQELRFPLLRVLWRPNSDEYNHLLAFKAREKEKRNLRRANRLSDQEIGTQLCQQFDDAFRIVERIKAREQLKHKSIKLQVMNFHNELKIREKDKQFAELIDSWRKENWQEGQAKDKQQIKQYQNQLEYIKVRRGRNQEEEQDEDNFDAILDPKLSTANFISTVLSYAQTFGVNYETVFTNKQMLYRQESNTSAPPPFPPREISSRPSFKIDLKPSLADKEQPLNVDRSQLLNMDLVIKDDMLIRSFSSTDLEQTSISSVHNSFLQYKRNEICNSYFGEDDEGDYKDLKKNIATNFKRFMQTKQQ